MENKKNIPLYKFKDYLNQYFKNITFCNTCKDAYFATEKQYNKQYGHNRFASYESFKSQKARYLKYGKCSKK